MIRPMASRVSALSSVVAKGHQAIHFVSSTPSYDAVRRVFQCGWKPASSLCALPQPSPAAFDAEPLLFALIHCGPTLPALADGVNRQSLPSFSRCSPTSGARWRAVAALAVGAGGNCAAGKPAQPRPRRVKPAARQSPPSRPLPKGASQSVSTMRRIRSRHLLEGSSSGGGGERPGRRTTSSGGSPRWRTPRILLLCIGGGGTTGRTTGSCRRRRVRVPSNGTGPKR
jgi:hypothetical protein